MKDRLLSDLWLMSAATFRRLGKIDQAKGAIQEAEVKDENNPAVWVQVRLSQFFVISFCLSKKIRNSLDCIISLLGYINTRWILSKKLCLYVQMM